MFLNDDASNTKSVYEGFLRKKGSKPLISTNAACLWIWSFAGKVKQIKHLTSGAK